MLKLGVFQKVKDAFNGNAIYVGDTISDFLSTKDTGINFVGVLTGSVGLSEFIQAGVAPWHIIPSIARLPDFLERRR